MAWSGDTFTRTNGVNSGTDTWEQDKAEPVNILASRHDAHDQDLATGINACVKKDGANAALVVATSWIQASAVTTAKIADAAITEAKLDDDAASRSTLLATFIRRLNGTLVNVNSYVPETFYLFNTGLTGGTVYLVTVPKACKVTHLTMDLSAAPGGSNSVSATLRKNGTTTSQAVGISNSLVTIGAVAAITAQSFTAGDTIDMLVTANPSTDIAGVFKVWGHFTA
jgi:hypothetical protein